MSNIAPMLTSLSLEWETPQDLYDKLDAEFGFVLDPCATDDNHKASRWFTKADDGLSFPWVGPAFMNPPYGREIGLWLAKAYRESLRGVLVVCLIPSRTDTAYWHDYVIKPGFEVRFIRGRLKFGGSKWNAPFPSCVVIMRPPELAEEKNHE